MQYFKTIEGMISNMLAEQGEKDDLGNPIVASEQPLGEEEYRKYKETELLEKTKNILGIM